MNNSSYLDVSLCWADAGTMVDPELLLSSSPSSAAAAASTVSKNSSSPSESSSSAATAAAAISLLISARSCSTSSRSGSALAALKEVEMSQDMAQGRLRELIAESYPPIFHSSNSIRPGSVWATRMGSCSRRVCRPAASAADGCRGDRG